MFDTLRETRESVKGVESRIPRMRDISRIDVQENRVEPYLGRHAEVTYEQLELLERIRVAAGQTS